MKIKALALAAAVFSLPAAATQAQELYFSYVGLEGALSFSLPSQPAPFATDVGFGTEVTPDGASFENGAASDLGGGVVFANADLGGGGFQTDDGLFRTYGAQIYGGADDAPTFSPGVFTLFGFDTVTPDGVLTISDSPPLVSAAPEPSSWALMLAGVAAAGCVLRRSRRRIGPPLRAGA